jgi:hypothetical protein
MGVGVSNMAGLIDLSQLPTISDFCRTVDFGLQVVEIHLGDQR